MKLLFINMFYPPQNSQTGHLMKLLVDTMSERGHEVIVVTGRAEYAGGGRHGGPSYERCGRVKTRRLWLTGEGKSSVTARILDTLLFFVQSTLYILCLRRTDVVVCQTAPPMLDVVGAVHSLVWRSNLVLVSLDNHPESLLRMGTLRKQSGLLRLLQGLRGLMAKRTDLVFAPDREMVRVLKEEGYDRAVELPYWDSDRDDVPIEPGEAEAFRQLHGWEGKFVLLYLGNMGQPHEFDTFLDAAGRTAGDDRILWAYIGGGSSWAPLRQAIARRGLRNCYVHDYIDSRAARTAIRASEVALICLKPPMVGVGSPSKVIPPLMHGRPILFVGPRESSVGRAAIACGTCVEIGDGEPAAQFALKLRQDSDLHASMCKEARSYYEAHYRPGESRRLFAVSVESLIDGRAR